MEPQALKLESFKLVETDDKRVFYSPEVNDVAFNLHRKWFFPPRPTGAAEENPNPFIPGTTWHQLMTLHWFHDAYAWAACIPLIAIPVAPFASPNSCPPLDYDPQTKLYSLSQYYVDEFDRRAVKLHTIFQDLVIRFKFRAVAPSFPWTWNYRSRFLSRGKARAVVSQARDWFQVWAGLFAYAIAFIEETPGQSTPDWTAFLRERKVPESWIDGIRWAASDSIPRAGIIWKKYEDMDAKMGYSMSGWTVFRHLKVPQWYEWTPELHEKFKNKPQLKMLSTMLRDAAADKEWSPHAPDDWPWQADRRIEPPKSMDPRVGVDETQDEGRKRVLDFYSRENQLARHKYMLGILAELEEKEKKLIAKETPQQKATRINRERQCSVKAPMFVYETDDDMSTLTPGILHKRPIFKSDRPDTLEAYVQSDRRYFPALNEWHLSEYYLSPDDKNPVPNSPSPEPDTHWGAHPDTSPDPPFQPPPPDCDVVQPDVHALVDDAEPTDRFRDVDGDDGLNSRLMRNLCCDAEEILGFVPPTYPDTLPPEPWSSVREMNAFLRTLGWNYERNHQGADVFLDTHDSRALWNLYKAFAFDTGNASTTPLFDLNSTCPKPFDVDRVFRKLRSYRINGEDAFVFHYDHPFRIVVYDPIVALAACRHDPEDAYEMARFLYRCGARFRTLQTQETAGIRTIRMDIPFTVPCRPYNYRFTSEDYGAYMGMVRGLLTMSRFRAAAMRGGYIWRVATYGVSSDDVCDGPSLGAKKVLERGDDLWFDDELTAEEEALLVGTYHIANKTGNGFNSVSWWPTIQIYEEENTGENYGFWTDFREVFYKEREHKILSGSGKPMSRGEWKKRFRGSGSVRQWRKTLKERSKAFIQERAH